MNFNDHNRNFLSPMGRYSQQNFKPARAIGDNLSWVIGAPTFDKTDSYRVRIKWTINMLMQKPFIKAGLFVVKYLNTVTRENFDHRVGEIGIINDGVRSGWDRRLQGGRVDKDSVLGAVVDPHALVLTMVEENAWKVLNLETNSDS